MTSYWSAQIGTSCFDSEKNKASTVLEAEPRVIALSLKVWGKENGTGLVVSILCGNRPTSPSSIFPSVKWHFSIEPPLFSKNPLRLMCWRTPPSSGHLWKSLCRITTPAPPSTPPAASVPHQLGDRDALSSLPGPSLIVPLNSGSLPLAFSLLCTWTQFSTWKYGALQLASAAHLPSSMALVINVDKRWQYQQNVAFLWAPH